ncbi:MAG: sensor histidine kinase N-terminal domain-containing protein [Rhodospirillales bacterium]|nr:sensor histidine kinase N-terminal domain-containing protein [Alphaproteobacteria bacterium]USO03068.1 MAG: sensor histidine kinase N-terminal domain-containing protein [Rhodospirillales bacterium]
MSKIYSLRKDLIVWISIPVLIATSLTLLIGFIFAWHEVEEVYDAQLVHSAKILLQLTEHEILEDEGFHLGVENANLEHKYEQKIGFRIWVNNTLITQSPNTLVFSDFEASPGFSDHQFEKNKWRFFVFLDPEHGIKIETSERYDIRYEVISQIMAALVLPGLVFIPLIFVIVWIGVRKVLKPVIKISANMDKRSPDDFSPIEQLTVAEEIVPLVQALNRLFGRIGESFRREREFTDYAAHELRTPLAAMKTQTQVLQKKANGMPESADSFKNLQDSIDRATQLVEQLLSLSRIQNEEFPKSDVNLSECLYECVDDIQPQAEKKKITIHAEIADDVFIKGHEDSIMILLRNLLDNAVKYTPQGQEVQVSLSRAALLDISDTGPGISDKDKEKVFQRFVRVDQSGQAGSGLGLSIVSWIASAHDVEIRLRDNDPHGLKVTLQWKPL